MADDDSRQGCGLRFYKVSDTVWVNLAQVQAVALCGDGTSTEIWLPEGVSYRVPGKMPERVIWEIRALCG